MLCSVQWFHVHEYRAIIEAKSDYILALKTASDAITAINAI